MRDIKYINLLYSVLYYLLLAFMKAVHLSLESKLNQNNGTQEELIQYFKPIGQN